MKVLVVCIAMVLFASCGGGEETKKASIDPNGPDVELVILDFNQEKSETKIEIINRLDDPIKSLSGRLIFHDEDGSVLTTATGRDLSSPFSLSTNPSIVKSMEKAEKTLRNKVPEGTFSITVEEIAGKTSKGSF